MQFGLFGGARTVIDGRASDSQMYTDYIDYVRDAEAMGFYGLFLVEHHFTGVGQISEFARVFEISRRQNVTDTLGYRGHRSALA